MRPALPAVLLTVWSLVVLLVFFAHYPLPVRRTVLLARVFDLSVALGLALAAALSGLLILRGLRLGQRFSAGAPRLLFATALGYGALGLAGLALARLQWLRPAPIAVAGLLLVAGAHREVAGLGASLREAARSLRRGWSAGGSLHRVIGVILVVAMALMLLEALAPPTSYDALRYQLRLPRLYADAGGWVPVSHDFNAAFPGNVNFLYALSLAVHAEGAAKLTHLLLGWLAVAAVALLASEAGGAAAGLPAAATFYTMPVAALNSAWAYVDMGLVLHTLLAVAALLAWWRAERHRVGWLVLMGLLLGLGLGTKYTGAVPLLVLPAAVALRPAWGIRRMVPALGSAALVVALALTVSAPWWAVNWVERGNPVYPFASRIFTPRPGDTYRAERHRAVLERPEVPARTLADVAALPWRFTMSPWVRDEMIGPALLVALPVLVLARGGGASGLLWLALVFALFWGFLSPQVRLYLHGLGLLAAATGAGLAALRARAPMLGRIGGVALVACMVLSTGNLAVMQKGLSDPFAVVVGMESRDHYLSRMVDGHDAIAFINRELPEGAKVLFVGEIYGYYCRRDYLLGSKFDRAPIVDLVDGSPDLEAFLARLRGQGFTHVLYSMHQLERFRDLPGAYLDWPDDAARRIYRRFMVEQLEPLFESPQAVVAAIRFEVAPPQEPVAGNALQP